MISINIWSGSWSQDSIEMIHFSSRSDTREADLIIPARDPSYVIGTVDLWGTVIEHERGYRAEFASVATLDDVIGKVDLEALRRRYRVRGSS